MKKTEKINDTVLKAVEKIARHEVEKNYFDWPPDCAGEAPGYSARASLSVAVRISKTEFKQNGFERDIAGCSISFLLQKNETKFFPVAY